MANTFKRDPKTGALINQNVSGYVARKAAKTREALIKTQQTKIETLETELTNLKARVTTLENNSPS